MFNCLMPISISPFFMISNFCTYLGSQRTENNHEKTKQNKSLTAHCDVPQISGFGGKRGPEKGHGIIHLEVAKS